MIRMEPTTWNYLKTIQDGQMRRWKNVLHPKKYEELERLVTERTETVDNPDEPIDFYFVEKLVFRGNQIDMLVHNVLMKTSFEDNSGCDE